MATPYDKTSTSTGVASDLSSHIAGKVVLTTGVSPNGLGAQFVEASSRHKPALLILAGRSPAKVQATADKITADPASKDVKTRVLKLDLASQKQIREAAKEVLSWQDVTAIDVVVNSAGVMAGPYTLTEEGIEHNFGSNHIGHFLFTNLIMSKILAAESPRVVNVSSDGHRLGPVRFDDYNFDGGKKYDGWEAYGQGKTANILFSKGLAQKLGSKGLKAYSLHPGVTFGTSLAPWLDADVDIPALKQKDKDLGNVEGEDDAKFNLKSLDGCAATHVVAAFDPRIGKFNGAYLEDGHVSDPPCGHTDRERYVCYGLRPTARREGDPERLWELSEKLVGEKFEY